VNQYNYRRSRLFIESSTDKRQCIQNFVLFNARSINNKLPELQHLLYSTEYDAIMISESWLSIDTPDSMIDPLNKYCIVRRDRPALGGGVCAIVSKLHCIVTIDLSACYPDLEVCCFDLLCNRSNQRCRIFVVYRPPDVHNMPRLVECLQKFTAVKYNSIIVGDFNCGDIDWQLLVAPTDGTQDALLNFVIAEGLAQVVQYPTRNERILDIILTNEPLAMCRVEVLHPFSTSDHNQIEFSVFTDCIDSNSDSDRLQPDLNVKHYDWSQADYDGMNNYIAAVDWLKILSVNLTADSLWAAFSDVLQTAVDLFVPVKSMSEYTNTKCRRWYPAALKRAITRKKCLWRKHRSDPDDVDALLAYRKAATNCKQMLREYEIKREQKVIDGNSAGGFFRFVNGKLSCRRGLGALCDDSGDVITSDIDRANLLNEYFASVGTVDNGVNPPLPRAVPPNAQLDSVNFTPDNVYSAMQKLKLGGSSGPDGFSPQLYKKLAGSLAEPMSLVFTSFMSVGQIPREWAHAIVTPVYKCGSASSRSNYRPISLTCVASKIMERVVVSNMLIYLRRNGVISKQQHGFLQGRSTTSNLLEALNDWTLTVNDRKAVGVTYIDFAKAFDTVCHSKLLNKLAAYGISGQLLQWIKSFLSDRSQQTRVGHSLSAVTKLSSGVVQGSVLGPLLFVLFINDIVGLFPNQRCKCKLYADDLKLYTVLEAGADYIAMQDKLNDICDWARIWQLSISYTKCNIMYIGDAETNADMMLNGNVVPVVDQVKDLGIIVDSSLSFSVHINKVVSQAFIRSNLIRRCFVSRHVPTLMRAFIVYVRPLVEYASCVWSPHHVTLVKLVESVQRRFTKRLPGFWALDYEARLASLGIDSLEARRLRQDLVYTYKIIFGLTDDAAGDFFTRASSDHNTRGHEYKLFPSCNRIDVRKYFFAERVVRPWNELPAQSEHFSSLQRFKNFVNSANLDKYMIS